MTIQQIDPGLVPYQILDPDGNLVREMPDLSAERMLWLVSRSGSDSRWVSGSAPAARLAGDLVPGNRLPICQRRSNTHHSLLISRLHASELAQRIALLADPDRDWHADAARRWPGNGCQNRR